jgi:hypothetical protein
MKEKQLIQDYHETFGTPAGKRCLDDLRKLSKLLVSSIPVDNTGKLDLGMLAYQTGQQSVLKHIYIKLNKNPNEPKQTVAIN